MSNIVIVGGGFGGVVAAESLAKRLDDEHEITLVSRSRIFLFYPALVRLALGQCEEDDIEFDLREALRNRKIRFVEGEVARIHHEERHITLAHGDFVGEMPYDYLVLALGRRLKTEQVTGFFEHGHHLLDIRGAKNFGSAARLFKQGRAVIGHCPGARLPVPVFETAFALSRMLEENGTRDRCEITVVSSEPVDEMFGGVAISSALKNALESHSIELLPNFAITEVTANSLIAKDGRTLGYDLNMLIPPFVGPTPLVSTGLTDAEGYLWVDKTMRAKGVDGMYAVGDCVSFKGPKMAHMAVRQGEVAAENLVAEIRDRVPTATYDHEMMLVVDAGDQSVFVHKDLWTDELAEIHNSRFWGWAKGMHPRYWKVQHA